MRGNAITSGRRALRAGVDRIVRAPTTQPVPDERQLQLLGRIASRQIATLDVIGTLADVEFRVTSQWGEDGIIEWLCQQLPDIEPTFVEFGVESYTEANTRFLLENRGWRGLVIDGNEEHVASIRAQEIFWMRDLSAVSAFITRDNINALIEEAGFHGQIGILSVDIDGNDYWVLRAIEVVEPAIVICEYNGLFGTDHAVTIPYDPDFRRHDAHYSGQYYGASILAIRRLIAERGYRFLGTNSTGVNAFFCLERYASQLPLDLGNPVVWPTSHSDTRDPDGELTFLRGRERLDLIAGLPLYDIDNETTATVGDLLIAET